MKWYHAILVILLCSTSVVQAHAQEKQKSTTITVLSGTLDAQSMTHHINNLLQRIDSTIVINSGGGIVDDAVGFYMLSKTMKNPPAINTIGTSIVGSAAVVVFCAGNERALTENAHIFLHPITTEVNRVSPNTLKKINTAMTQGYATIISHCTNGKKTPEEIEQLMDQTVFLSAEEALAIGIATEIKKLK